jgi:nitrite reductase/ring-hydroxylating ferredoxin subunit/uncharacterized membrane protein
MPRDLDEKIATTLAASPSLRTLSKTTRKWLSDTFLESPLNPVKNFLNGTWLEHPLHPVLVDIPIGAWAAALALDLMSLGLGTRGLGKASGIAIGVGTLGALASAATGLMDYTDSDPPEDTTILTHGVVNITATLLFTGSFLLRRRDNWQTQPSHFALAALGYAAVMVGGFLGGSLIFRHGVMVNRNAYRAEPKKFSDAIALKDLPENKLKRVEVDGEPVLMLRRGEDIYALGAVCSHYGAPMEKGKLDEDTVECPWHYSVYSLADGAVQRGPTTAPLPAYETRVREGQVQVRLVHR